MLLLLPTVLAQDNGVVLCEDYVPFFADVDIDPTCGDTPDPAISRVNACFTSCASGEQQFWITVVNRGASPATDIEVRVLDGGTERFRDTIATLGSAESVQVGPVRLDAASFDADLIAILTASEDCQEPGNTRLLATALFDGVWPEPTWDADQDGFSDDQCGGDDCDDTDPAVFPGAPEPLGEDRDCDGFVDEEIRRCSTAPGALGWVGWGLPLLLVLLQWRKLHR